MKPERPSDGPQDVQGERWTRFWHKRQGRHSQLLRMLDWGQRPSPAGGWARPHRSPDTQRRTLCRESAESVHVEVGFGDPSRSPCVRPGLMTKTRSSVQRIGAVQLPMAMPSTRYCRVADLMTWTLRCVLLFRLSEPPLCRRPAVLQEVSPAPKNLKATVAIRDHNTRARLSP